MSRSASRFSAIAVVTAVLTACGADEASRPRASASVTTDSAGVSIVEVTRDSWAEGEGWTVDATPLLVIGSGGDPDAELFRVRGAVRLSDGRIAVANGGSDEIRLFDAEGNLERAIGRKGEGPGEFETLFGLDRRGDTILAHDYWGPSAERFTADGRFLGATTLATVGNIPLRVFPTSWGYLALHLEYTQDLPEDFKLTRRRAHYVRYDTAGDTLGKMDVLPGREMIYRGRREGEMTVMTSTEPLFGHTEHEAAVGDRFVAGVTDHFQFRVYSADGRLERLIRAPSRERPVSQDEWDRALQEELAASEDTPEARRAVREQADLAPAPEVRPAFGPFVADGDHYLWVGPYRPEPGPTVAWTVVDIDGAILGTVDVPQGLRILEVGADYVLGSMRDELGVETVRLYRLHR